MSVKVHTSSIHRGDTGDAPLVTAWTDYIPVLDKGFIRLEGALASDLDPVNAARVSFDGRSRLHDASCPSSSRVRAEQTGCKCEAPHELDHVPNRDTLGGADAGLINFLARDRHGTPFEHSFFRFEVKAPIMVFREWHRHRIGMSYNEQSGRYMQLAREFYVPAAEDFRVQQGKPGAYYFTQDEDVARVEAAREAIRHSCTTAFDEYEAMLEEGIAKEIARLVLPVNTYSTMWFSTNPRSLMSFLSLRNAPNAQKEIRAYAEVMEEIFLQTMPVTAAAFVEHGRQSP